MKKSFESLLSFLLCFTILFSISTAIGSAAFTESDIIDSGTCGDNAAWTLSEDGVLTISGTGAMRDYSYLDDTHAPWYGNSSLIESVVVNNGVTNIGDYAFDGCTEITSVTLPDGVIRIGDNAFILCSDLKSITISDSVASIGKRAFGHCYDLESVTLSDNLKSIGEEAFSSCSSLTSIAIPDSVTSIGEYAFSGVNNVSYSENMKAAGSPWGAQCVNGYIDGYLVYSDSSKTTLCGCSAAASGFISIPDSVTTIGDNAFSSCTGIISIDIPDSVTSIGTTAFYDVNNVSCSENIKEKIYYLLGPKSINGYIEGYLAYSDESKETLRSCSTSAVGLITISDGVKDIKSSAFSYCENITGIIIPDGVTSIGSYAFSYCKNLTSINIPDSVTVIGNSAFYHCSKLTNIVIHGSVTSIGDEAFYGCSSLTSIAVDNNNQCYSSDEHGVLFNKNKTELIRYPGNNGETVYTIPDGVTSIGKDAFESCRNLTSAIIPDSITDIGYCAFSSCTSLTSMIIPDSVTSIDNSAFELCTNLTNVIFSDNITSIGSNAFYYCTNLTSINIPDSVKSIGYQAFSYCTNLTSINIPDSATNIGYQAFYKSGYYNNKSNWENDVLYIGNYLLEAKHSITGDYEIKSGTKVIADQAFYNCTSLTGITIPDSVTVIGNSAFSNCRYLASITVPDSITSIGCSSFYGTDYYNNKSNWENNVLYIGNYLLEAKENITGDYEIKSGTKIIADQALDWCTNLTSINIPDSVTSIGYHAFSYCTNLTSVTVPDSVTYIGTEAFGNCSKELVICGFSGSAAEEYAVSNNINFRSLDGPGDNAEYKVGDIIEFGWYPQSEVTDTDIISILNDLAGDNKNWTSYNYYTGTGVDDDGNMKPSGYMRYKDIIYNGKKYRGVYGDKLRPWNTGETPVDSTSNSDGSKIYLSGNAYWFVYEPIKWRVLDAENGILMSETVLDSQAFNNYGLLDENGYWGNPEKTDYANDYSKSSIREWLNNDFCRTAFSQEQLDSILYTELDNRKHYNSGFADGYESTTDKVYLLSYADVMNEKYGFSDVEYNLKSRCAGITSYSVIQGLDHYKGRCNGWNLRTAGETGGSLYEISRSGAVAFSENKTNYTYNGVRPVLRLNLTEDIIQSPVTENDKLSVSDESNKVTLRWNKGTFDDDIKLVVESRPEQYNTSFKLGGNYERNIYDIYVVDGNGNRVQPRNGRLFELEITVDESLNGKYVLVIHYLENALKEYFKDVKVVNNKIKIKTNHFSEFVVYEVPDIGIENFKSSFSADYKSKLTFNANITDVGESNIHWFVNGKDVQTGSAYTIDSAVEKEYEVQIKVIVDGETVSESEVETVNVKTNFFAKLIAFFRGLFGKLPEYVDNFKVK